MFIFQHCFINPPRQLIGFEFKGDLNLSLAWFGVKLAKGIDHIAFNINTVKFEIAQIQVDQ